MNESMIDILSATIIVIILIFSGVVAGWVWGYGTGYRKAIGKITKIRFNYQEHPCTQCGATMPEHYHGCTIAAEFKLVTVAKPGG